MIHNKIVYNKGEKIGEAFYVEDAPYHGERRAFFKCRCDKVFDAEISKVKRRVTKSCGCLLINYLASRTKKRELIACGCGCNNQLCSVTKHGRSIRFIHGHNKGHAGFQHTKASTELISRQRQNKCTGSANVNWKGGITPESKKLRESVQYKLWREAVFQRDNFTCQECGEKESVSGHLEAHHMKPFSLFPEFRFAIDNGETLCEECHRQTKSYSGRCRQLTRASFEQN